jgi:hypothetical protein
MPSPRVSANEDEYGWVLADPPNGGFTRPRDGRDTPDMTQLELEIAALRERRHPSGLIAWLRGLRPFDRRAIRVPGERDAYWVTIQQRLAQSDASFLLRREPSGSTEPADR